MEKAIPQLNPSRIKISEYERTVYVATVEMGTSRETLTEPSFWSHFAARLRPWDRIEVRTDDGTYYAEFLVLACDRTWAKVKELSFVQLTTSDVSLTEHAIKDGLEVKYRGPHSKFGVVREGDGAVLKEGIQTKKEAETWLEDYRVTIASAA